MNYTLRISALLALISMAGLTGCNSTGGSAGAPIQVNKMGDGNMTCEQIVAETNQMNQILGIAEGEMRNAQVLGLTEGLATTALVHSGAFASAGSSMPYLGGAISAASQFNSMNKEQAEERARAAFNRRSVLTGMYAAKGCGQ